jgi:cytochrome c oxidase subunit 3
MDYSRELAPEVREKMKKNLVYVGVFSIVMLFAGLTSAYIVSMGDSFWLKYPLPTPFWVSTALIVLSSLSIILSIWFVKNNKAKASKLMVVLTFLCGIGFMVYQLKGYSALIDQGIHPVSNHIIVTEGRYGDYFEVKYKGQFLEVDGNDYLINGKKLSDAQTKAYQTFMAQFDAYENKKALNITNYGKEFILYYNAQPVGFIDGQLTMSDGKPLQFVDLTRLKDLAIHVRDGRGDFFVQGKIGTDFHIYYKGKELQYENRELRMDGKKLSKYLQIKAMESADTASAYLFIITILHLLHIAIAMIYMGKMTLFSLAGKFTAEENLSLRLGGIFWHFLGVLWIYLLLFLLFIH